MWTTADDLSHAAIFTAVVRGPDAGDRDVEELLDRFSDVDLGRLRVHTKGVFTAILIRRRGLLGDDRSDDCASQCWHRLLPLFLAGRLLGRRFLCTLGRCLWLPGLAGGLGSLSRRLVRVGALGGGFRRLALGLLRAARLGLRLRSCRMRLFVARGELITQALG